MLIKIMGHPTEDTECPVNYIPHVPLFYKTMPNRTSSIYVLVVGFCWVSAIWEVTAIVIYLILSTSTTVGRVSDLPEHLLD
jgi:hypothetical protein